MSTVDLPVTRTYWADVLESILSVACQSLSSTPLGMPANCYVGHSRPADDCCDFLAVWIDGLRPTIQFPFEFSDYDRCEIVRMMMDVTITLRRPCWPVVVDSAFNPFPEASKIDAASTSLAIDAQALWSGVVQAYDAGALFYTPRPPNYIKWGSMSPMTNMGGCAGWQLKFTVDLDECA